MGRLIPSGGMMMDDGTNIFLADIGSMSHHLLDTIESRTMSGIRRRPGC
ncbi:MAG: hypothetical protein J0I76_04365 [Thiobacillus sp.]|nr:hypothetical protein [Thiobacillus sp.]